MPAAPAKLHLLVMSDTHLRDAAKMPPALLALAQRADHIVHAGDHSTLEITAVLETFAPVTAVCGNVEEPQVAERLPVLAFTNVGEVRVGVVHDAGQREGRHARLARRLPDCRIRVYGHSHLPEVSRLRDRSWVINPGSPTQRRRAPFHSVAWITLSNDSADGEYVSVELIDLDSGSLT